MKNKLYLYFKKVKLKFNFKSCIGNKHQTKTSSSCGISLSQKLSESQIKVEIELTLFNGICRINKENKEITNHGNILLVLCRTLI